MEPSSPAVEAMVCFRFPELPTSWFSTQRWLQLDASWQVLFRGPNADTAG
jgi:hypothetical protein